MKSKRFEQTNICILFFVLYIQRVEHFHTSGVFVMKTLNNIHYDSCNAIITVKKDKYICENNKMWIM